jgi:hypothetical protein
MSICGATSADEDDDTSYAGVMSLCYDKSPAVSGSNAENSRCNNKASAASPTDSASNQRPKFDFDQFDDLSVASGGSLGPKRVVLVMDADDYARNLVS